jgi:transcriptional regulator with XRE-family HTH domain
MSESLGEQIRRVLQEAPFAMRQLAADAGLSYDVLRSWRSGRRRPSRSSALRLAAGLQQRGELLLRLSSELREAAEPGSGGPSREPGGEPHRPDRPGSYAADATADRPDRPGDDGPLRPGEGPGAGGTTWRETAEADRGRE